MDQMAATNECRSRWLRAPATKTAKNPSNFNELLGFCFGAKYSLNKINDLKCTFKSPSAPLRFCATGRSKRARTSYWARWLEPN